SVLVFFVFFFFFFFSSRRRHTRSKRDWSSDVCSSDLPRGGAPPPRSSASPMGPMPCSASACWTGPGALRTCWSRRLSRNACCSEIGRASCRERVEIWGGAEAVKKKSRDTSRQWYDTRE